MNDQPTIPGGPVQMTWYRNGYQQALADLAGKLEEGGEAAAREWITNNRLIGPMSPYAR